MHVRFGGRASETDGSDAARRRCSTLPYVPSAAGFLYLAVVVDAWSRKIVGWAMANHLRTDLVLDALGMAIGQRRPHDVIHHSDSKSAPASCSSAGPDHHSDGPFG